MERGRLGLRVAAAKPQATRRDRIFVFLASVAIPSIVLACSAASPIDSAGELDTRVSISDGWLAMGTFYEIDVRVPVSRAQEALDWIRETRHELARLEKIFSRHDPSSELSQLNRRRQSAKGSADGPTISEELSGLLREADRMKRVSGGAFDVSFDSPRIDLDAISKGAVLDRLRARFTDRFEGSAALMSLGQSSITAVGDPRGEGWRLVVQSRDPARGILGEIWLEDRSLSMSSSFAWDDGGSEERGARLVDPEEGRPVEEGSEAAVICESAAAADAWSTAIVVRGRLPETLDVSDAESCEAIFFDSAGRVSQTPGWRSAAARK
jgi:thiamine biosynthesis lipoprotein ApbE